MTEILYHFVREGLSPHPLDVNIAATQVQKK